MKRKPFFMVKAETPSPEDANQPFDVATLEEEIASAARSVGHPRDLEPVVQYAPKAQLPDYIVPHPGTPDIGRLTAEAVAGQYEEAAKSVEQMARELVELHKRMEAETAEVHKVIDMLKSTADRAREKGRDAYARIEAMATLTAQVRTSCEEISNKLALP